MNVEQWRLAMAVARCAVVVDEKKRHFQLAFLTSGKNERIAWKDLLTNRSIGRCTWDVTDAECNIIYSANIRQQMMLGPQGIVELESAPPAYTSARHNKTIQLKRNGDTLKCHYDSKLGCHLTNMTCNCVFMC